MPQPRSSGTLMVNGIGISYALEGPARATVVMLSNSLLTDYRMWDAQMAALTAGHRVLRYDTRGHGGTQGTSGAYTMALLAQDVVALLDRLSIQRVHFVGLSMGGMIAQRLAARHPDRLVSVALCDTACQLPPRSAWQERIALAHSKGIGAFVAPMTERWLTTGFRQRHPEIVDRLRAMITRTSVDGLVGCASAIMEMDHLPLLGEINVPAQVIVGEHDVGTPVSAAEVLHRGIKGSRLSVIRDAGHLPNIEQTKVFNKTLLGFLAECRSS